MAVLVEEPPPRYQRSSLWATTVNMTNAVLGAGMLALPHAFEAAQSAPYPPARLPRCAMPGATSRGQRCCGSSSASAWSPTPTCAAMTCCKVSRGSRPSALQRRSEGRPCAYSAAASCAEHFGGSHRAYYAWRRPMLRRPMRRILVEVADNTIVTLPEPGIADRGRCFTRGVVPLLQLDTHHQGVCWSPSGGLVAFCSTMLMVRSSVPWEGKGRLGRAAGGTAVVKVDARCSSLMLDEEAGACCCCAAESDADGRAPHRGGWADGGVVG